MQKDWDSWRWQLKNRVTSVEAMARILGVPAPVFEKTRRQLPAAATPYYLWVASRSESVRRCILPDVRETLSLPFETPDPLGEEGHSPVPGIVHRYPDRVLFLVTEFCSTYCRYCTRSRLVGKAGHRSDMRSWQAALDYIREHDEVRDVLLSGGDPLTLPDMKLEWLLSQLRAIPHVEIIRIGSKVPAVLPQRITPKLVRMLRRYHPLFISLHFAHPDEMTPDTALACNRLADGGIPWEPDSASVRRQRRRADHEAAHARADPQPRAALLPVPVRPDSRIEPFPDSGGDGADHHPESARAHFGLLHPDLCHRCSRRRWQGAAATRLFSG